MPGEAKKETKNLLIIILLILIVFLLGIIIGLFITAEKPTDSKVEPQEAETYVAEPQPKKETDISQSKTKTGFIEGSLGYPSEGIPSDMEICAENLTSKEIYCTTDHLQNSKYTYGFGYKIEVPVANYYVFSTSSLFGEPDYKAYYSSFVTCGMRDKCRSHNPISITVSEGKTTSNVDPIDWYAP